MIATTISSSMSVKPFCFFILPFSPFASLYDLGTLV